MYYMYTLVYGEDVADEGRVILKLGVIKWC